MSTTVYYFPTVDPNDKGEAAATEVTDVSDLPGKLTLSLPESLSSILMPPPLRPPNVLLAGSPSWTGRLSDCEVSMLYTLDTVSYTEC